MFQKIIDNHVMVARREIESTLSDFCTLFRNHPKELKLIVENWEQFNSLLKVPTGMGGLGVEYRPASWGNTLIDQIGWIRWFIEHEISDDGDPRVLYYRRPVRALSGPEWIAAVPSEATGCVILCGDAFDTGDELTSKSLSLTADDLREAILFQKKRDLTRETVQRWRGSLAGSSNSNETYDGMRLREVLNEIQRSQKNES